MRDSASVIVYPLPHVINLFFIQGIVPDDLKSARVVPLFIHIFIALSVRPTSCPVHISRILGYHRMHIGMAKCRLPFSGHCDLDL